MRILITGGAGFVGSNLAVALKCSFQTATIVCMDNLYRQGSELNLPRLKAHEVEFHSGDVREPETFPPGPFDFVADCSAEPSVFAGMSSSPDYLIQTNLMGAYYCLEKARLWKSGFLFLSTSRVYPIGRLESHSWREELTRFVWEDQGTVGITSNGVSEAVEMTGPRSLYGYTKYAAEQLIDEYRLAFGLRTVVNRCGVIAGPWQFGKVDQGVASLWVLAHHFNRPLSYRGYGGLGKQVRDFLHVSDLSDLVIEQVRHFDEWNGWVGNVSGGASNAASLCELTALCQEVVGRKIPIASVTNTHPVDLRIYIGDCTRLFKLTPWRPRRDVRTIVRDIAAWAEEHSGSLRGL